MFEWWWFMNNLCFVHCNCWQRCNSYEWYFLPRYILNYVLNCNSVRFVSYIYHKSNVIRPPTHSWHQLFGCELSFKILNEKVVTLSHCHFILYYMHVTILIRISIIQGSFMPNWLWTQESIERENEWFPHWIDISLRYFAYFRTFHDHSNSENGLFVFVSKCGSIVFTCLVVE